MYLFDVYTATETHEVEAELVFDFSERVDFIVGNETVASFMKANIIGWRKVGKCNEQPG